MFALNFASRDPIYIQLYKNVVQQISLGVLKPDDQLPPMRSLALDLGINPNTVSKAYQNLESDGYIYSLVGRGSFVSPNINLNSAKKQLMLEELEKLIRDAVRLGVTEKEIINIINKVFPALKSKKTRGDKK